MARLGSGGVAGAPRPNSLHLSKERQKTYLQRQRVGGGLSRTAAGVQAAIPSPVEFIWNSHGANAIQRPRQNRLERLWQELPRSWGEVVHDDAQESLWRPLPPYPYNARRSLHGASLAAQTHHWDAGELRGREEASNRQGALPQVPSRRGQAIRCHGFA